MSSKLIVIAIGGNSLIEDKNHVTVAAQYEAARKTAHEIAKVVKMGHRVVVVHGNGPQVGYILLRAEYARKILHAVPLDSCVADTQGAIGYQLQRAFDNEFMALGVDKSVVTLVSQVVVDPNDPSFYDPSKPIGSFMSEEDALYHKKENGWNVREDAGRGWRRVVPAPRPKEIVELESIEKLLSLGEVVIALGGGGIPVVKRADGSYDGVEAVIDKDLASSLLARKLKADLFLISTAVEKVCLNWGKSDMKALDSISLDDAKLYMAEGHFAKGSMLEKIEAITEYLEDGGKLGIITDPEHIVASLDGKAGTSIHP